MARKTLENVKKKQPVDFLQSIKDLTKWITSNNHDDDQLVYLIDKYQIKNTVVKRILSYNYGFPHIIKYFNTYLNDLYEFEGYDTRLLIKSLIYLMNINNRCNSKSFVFIKSSTLKDDISSVIKNLIKDYLLTVYGIECNRYDLNIYYKLFKMGVIKDEDLLEIDKLLNGDKPLIHSLNFIDYDKAINPQDLDVDQVGERNISQKIEDFIYEIKKLKKDSDKCKTCPLFNKPIVVLDSNKKDLGEVDIAFIGLNPGKEEAEKDLPFIGDSGKYIRKLITQLPNDKTWVIFNVILCSTANKTEIGTNITPVIENCLNITTKIFENFPAKTYIPIGDDAKSIFRIDEKISTASGKVYPSDNGVNIIPLIHPSSVMRNSKNKAIYDKSVQNIINFIDPSGVTPKTKSTPIHKESIITDDKDLLLIDVKKIENNQVLMIYTDLAGNKKYMKKEYSFPVLIKNKEWNQCDMITNKINDTCSLNDWQKSNLSKKCRQILKKIVSV